MKVLLFGVFALCSLSSVFASVTDNFITCRTRVMKNKDQGCNQIYLMTKSKCDLPETQASLGYFTEDFEVTGYGRASVTVLCGPTRLYITSVAIVRDSNQESTTVTSNGSALLAVQPGGLSDEISCETLSEERAKSYVEQSCK